MASLGYGVLRARMIASDLVSEFSECSKNRVEQTFVSCTAPEVLTVPPALVLVPVTLLVFFWASKATTSSFSHSFISIFFSNFQSPMFRSMSLFQSPGPAPVFFPTYFGHGVAVSISAIFAPAIIALVVGRACKWELSCAWPWSGEEANYSTRLVFLHNHHLPSQGLVPWQVWCRQWMCRPSRDIWAY